MSISTLRDSWSKRASQMRTRPLELEMLVQPLLPEYQKHMLCMIAQLPDLLQSSHRDIYRVENCEDSPSNQASMH